MGRTRGRGGEKENRRETGWWVGWASGTRVGGRTGEDSGYKQTVLGFRLRPPQSPGPQPQRGPGPDELGARMGRGQSGGGDQRARKTLSHQKEQ